MLNMLRQFIAFPLPTQKEWRNTSLPLLMAASQDCSFCQMRDSTQLRIHVCNSLTTYSFVPMQNLNAWGCNTIHIYLGREINRTSFWVNLEWTELQDSICNSRQAPFFLMFVSCKKTLYPVTYWSMLPKKNTIVCSLFKLNKNTKCTVKWKA